MPRRINWPQIVDKLNREPGRKLRFKMGTPGSAQATRCRLLNEWTNIEAWTVRDILYVQLKSR